MKGRHFSNLIKIKLLKFYIVLKEKKMFFEDDAGSEMFPIFPPSPN